MGAKKSSSVVVRFTRFVERRLGLLVIIGMVVGALAAFTSNVEKIVGFVRTYLAPGATTTAPTSQSSSPRALDKSLQTGGGKFAGFDWRYVRDRGGVQILEEKLKLFSHRAEALAWIDGPERRDFRFACVVELVSGDQSLGFGPVFWLRDERNFFHFAVRTAGDYRLVRYRDGNLDQLITWKPSPKVRPVLTRERLEVIAKQNRIDLLVDGAVVDHYELSGELSQAGRVGVFAADGGLTVEVTQVELEP